ncbi:unnamed protein product [Didymodactylos carnosus]|uniref:Uncharacterized protein n=1 Tax=Didymodactylos carnosus TaxID=1234261 RepID=A0A8S2QWC5_9BILA|nr:unnamed protein product [Didymodactylos carnosus]CAF4125360.1 unnamed protein product [Didymodactylos carnosus]
MALYAQTSGTHTTNSGTFVAIPGLSITVPAGVGTAVHRPHPDDAGCQRAAGKRAADHQRDVVRRTRQHGHHRLPGNAERNPLLARAGDIFLSIQSVSPRFPQFPEEMMVGSL